MKLEKVQRRAAGFVHNNYWPMASVTEMISDLNWESLEIRRQNARLCMFFKAINGLIKIPMDHYHSSLYTSTRSFHGQNLLGLTPTNIRFPPLLFNRRTAYPGKPLNQIL